MQLSTNPDPIRAGEPATVKIALTDGDPDGTYTFKVFPEGLTEPQETDDKAEKIFDPLPDKTERESSIEFPMAQDTDIEPPVFVEQPGKKTLKATIVVARKTKAIRL